MKLIIDIDEEQYEFIKEYVKDHDLFEEVYQNIADGTPVNTDGDTISRSALKEEVKKLNEMLPNLTDEKDKQSVRFAINILQNLINNLPAVESIKEIHLKDLDEEDKQAFIDLLSGSPIVGKIVYPDVLDGFVEFKKKEKIYAKGYMDGYEEGHNERPTDNGECADGI